MRIVFSDGHYLKFNVMITWLLFVLSMSGLVSGCGRESRVPRPGCNSDKSECRQAGTIAPTDPSNKNSAAGSAVSGDAVGQYQAISSELSLLEAWNLKLCEKVNELLVTCPLSVPILPESSEKVLQCSAAASGAQVKQVIRAVAVAKGVAEDGSALEGQVVPLSLFGNGGSIESNALSSDGLQKVTWKTGVSGNLDSPRMRDFFNLRLKDSEGRLAGKFALKNVVDFSLEIGGQTLIRKTDLVADPNGGVVVNVNALKALESSVACKVSADEVAQLREAAKQQVEQLKPANAAQVTEEKARAEIAQKQTLLDRERGRSSALKAALGVETTRGCFADLKLNSLEIQLSGAPGGNGTGEVAAGQTSSPMKSEGAANSYTFQLSDSLKISATNENGGSLFQPNGKVMKNDFDSFPAKIGDLKFLRIVRNGTSFNSTPKQSCWGGFLGIGSGCKTEFENFETQVMSLSRVKILVNGQVAYERDAIDFTFKRDSLEFIDPLFTNNIAWQTLMGRSDCGAFASKQ